MKKLKEYLPGVFLSTVIAFTAFLLNLTPFGVLHIESVTLAILMGMLIKNMVKLPSTFHSGIQFSLSSLLKTGIVFLGLKLDLKQLYSLGGPILLLVVGIVSITLVLAFLLSKIFKLNLKSAVLIGVGSSICGASAIVATAPCIRSRQRQTILAVTVVNFLGTIGMIIYSSIANAKLGFTPEQYGLWSGASLHGVAHALAAASAMGANSIEVGTLVKMARVFMLLPVSVILTMLFRLPKSSDGKKSSIGVPLYLIMFVIMVLINSFSPSPKLLKGTMSHLSHWLILIAMTAMGLSVHLKDIVKAGLSGLGVGLILFLFTSGVSLLFILNFI